LEKINLRDNLNFFRGGARFSELRGPGQVVVDLPPPALTPPPSPIQESSDLRQSHGSFCWRLEVRTPGPSARRCPWTFLQTVTVTIALYTHGA